MKNLNRHYYNPFFSHIYVEKKVLKAPRTRRILDRFPKADIIEIDHYKDVFCRKGQDYILQHHAQNLILGAKQGNLIYEGSPVCQDFGYEHFYYTSCMMNCIYDCEYCYLKGMYPSGNLVMFVNLEDIFDEVQKLLGKHSLYLCISYDTDLLAMEQVTGYVQEWNYFAGEQKDLTIEIRTKSADISFWETHSPIPEMIYAITLSPQAIINAYEHQTPSLSQRIASASAAIQKGFSIRLCFDPMIYCPNWEQHYHQMIEQVFSELDMKMIKDVSVGTFRVSQDYLKKMRKIQPYSAVVQFPFQNNSGVYHYPERITKQMEQYLISALNKSISQERIFCEERRQERHE